MKIEQINKLYMIFFAILLSAFNLSISMEQHFRANVEDVENHASLSQMPIEIKYEILNIGVDTIIINNYDLKLSVLIKLLAQYLFPLKLSNQSFNELISNYISRNLNDKLKSHDIYIDQKYGVNGCTPLMDASLNGCEGLVKLLISAGAKLNEKNNDEYTALILAIIRQRGEIAKLLVDSGAEIYSNNNDNYDDVALSYAVIAGHTEIVKLLIEKGAKLYIGEHRGDMALAVAKNKGYNNILTLLKNAAA